MLLSCSWGDGKGELIRTEKEVDLPYIKLVEKHAMPDGRITSYT